MNRRLKLAAIGVIGAGALALGAAGPAFADTGSGPSSSAQATVSVLQSISFAFDSSPSFSLNPGVTSANAVSFTISTNSAHGYAVTLSAPDLQTAGGVTLPATDLSYQSFQAGIGQLDQGPQQLTNTAVTAFTKSQATNGDHISQNWLASIPANTVPGSYQTTLTYTAVATP